MNVRKSVIKHDQLTGMCAIIVAKSFIASIVSSISLTTIKHET